jgi:hypothetical protein
MHCGVGGAARCCRSRGGAIVLAHPVPPPFKPRHPEPRQYSELRHRHCCSTRTLAVKAPTQFPGLLDLDATVALSRTQTHNVPGPPPQELARSACASNRWCGRAPTIPPATKSSHDSTSNKIAQSSGCTPGSSALIPVRSRDWDLAGRERFLERRDAA